jgi:uncharacterized pyridoxamine 5'-phosphate oxidase family protein/NAD-dependent dihydropyrimidine dehydrogenase PreA subunit
MNRADASQQPSAPSLEEFEQYEGLDLSYTPQQLDGVDATYCLRYLRAVRDCVAATVDEDGRPAARVIDVMGVARDTVYLLTPRGKMFKSELSLAPWIALVGQTPDYRTVRLKGKVAEPPTSQRKTLVDTLYALNPTLAELYPDDSRQIFDVLCLSEGEGEYYDLGQSPLVRVPFAIGDVSPSRRGQFEITAACIECGVCMRQCPGRCIKTGKPYSIAQEHCLRCGLCREVCPCRAVRQIGDIED